MEANRNTEAAYRIDKVSTVDARSIKDIWH